MDYRVWIFFIFILQGCLSFSKYPLSTPEATNSALFGKWSVAKNGHTSYLSIQPSTQKNIFLLRYEESNDPNHDETIRLNGFTSVLNGQNYLNLKITYAKDKFPKGYIFCRYRIEKQILHLRPINPEVIQAAIRAKKLKGRIEDDTFLSYAIVTEDPDELQKYIVRYSDTLFPKELFFHKEDFK